MRIIKKENIVYLFMFVVLLIIFVILYYSKNDYNSRVISSQEWKTITSKRKKSNKLKLSDLRFNGNSLFYDNKNNNWYYSVVDGKDKYNPKVNYKANSEVMIVFSDKIDEDRIEKNYSFRVMIYNNKYYNIYKLSVTTLPLMNISYNNNIEIIKDDKTDIEFNLYDNSKHINKRFIKSKGNIHFRGVTSLNYPKKGYKISLKTDKGYNNNISLLNMREDDDWVLYPAYNDQEKIRNVFSSRLWYESSSRNNMFNIDNGMYYKYVELFLNSQYWGLYALGYPIDSKQLNLAKDEFLFKKRDWASSESEVLENKKIEQLKDYDLKSKSVDDKKGWKQLIKYYKILQTTHKTDEIYRLVDIDNEIDYYLFINLIQGSDNVNDKLLKNCYITLKKYKNRYIALYTPWDMDMTFGNTWASKSRNYTKINSLKYNDNIEFNLSSINMLLNLDDKNIMKKLKTRYEYLRNNEWSDKYITKLIDEYEKDIYDSGAFIRDENRWPDGNYTENGIKLTEFRNYVLKRFNYFDKYVKSL